MILSVLAVFAVKASMTGRSRTEAMGLAEFYLRGRESSTLGVVISMFKCIYASEANTAPCIYRYSFTTLATKEP